MKELWHAGEDWFAPVNTPINAVGEGVVTYVSPSWYDYKGAVVIIKHTLSDGSHIWSMYGHLDRNSITVSEGGQVKKDNLKIADRLYDWDWANNTHLHWEMRYFPDGSGIKKAPDYMDTCSGPPGPGYTYPEHPDNFAVGKEPYHYTNPSAFVKAH